MEHDHPGYHKLVQAGIASEGAAEQLARISPLGDETNEAVPSKAPAS
jgi:hypothetical protein